MPYIDPARRTPILDGSPPINAGELNFLVTMAIIAHGHGPLPMLREKLKAIARAYLMRDDGLRYQKINDVAGVFYCAGRELRRRVKADTVGIVILLRETMHQIYDDVAAPYEDLKVQENGDIPYDSYPKD